MTTTIHANIANSQRIAVANIKIIKQKSELQMTMNYFLRAHLSSPLFDMSMIPVRSVYLPNVACAFVLFLIVSLSLSRYLCPPFSIYRLLCVRFVVNGFVNFFLSSFSFGFFFKISIMNLLQKKYCSNH